MHHGGGAYGGLISVKGTDGEANDGGFRDKKRPVPNIYMPNYKGNGGIFGDFLYCVKTRERPFRDIAIARAHARPSATWATSPTG